MTIPNVLAERYASQEIKDIWSPRGKILLEREFWLAVLKAQKELGSAVPDQVISAYEKVKDKIDLESIKQRERKNLHDVKARLEEFAELAGSQHIHKGMTSRDLTENVEQLQIYRSLLVIGKKTAAALHQLATKAHEFRNLVITARTHNVPAQATTLGKRLAMFGQEMLIAFERLQHLIDNYPLRGLKGAVGTQLDQQTLLGPSKAAELEKRIVGFLGLPRTLNAVGQVYPRSLDFEVVSVLVQAGSGMSSFALTLRLMAGSETAGEGFAQGQVGSSAMPHKMNSRSCERINGFQKILAGYLYMLQSLAGDQWNEGDVSCSVVRRVALPDSFFTMDGMLDTFLTVLRQMEIYKEVIARENQYYLPFLNTTTILMEAVKKGAGREAAHEAIKEHAVATVRALRNGEIASNDLLARLASDNRLNLTRAELEKIYATTLTGAAEDQVAEFIRQAREAVKAYPAGIAYQPGAIL